MKDCCYNCKFVNLEHEECTKYSDKEVLPRELSLEKLVCWRAIPISREIIKYVENELNQEFGSTLVPIYEVMDNVGCSESYVRKVLRKSKTEIYEQIKEAYGKHSGWLRELNKVNKFEEEIDIAVPV